MTLGFALLCQPSSKAIKAGAKVMIVSHLGRPAEGVYTHEYSLAPVADYLATLLDRPVRLVARLAGTVITYSDKR